MIMSSRNAYHYIYGSFCETKPNRNTLRTDLQTSASRGRSLAQHRLTWIVGKSMQVRVHWVCPLLTVAADHCCPGMKGPPSGERYQQQHPEEANQYTQALFVLAKGPL